MATDGSVPDGPFTRGVIGLTVYLPTPQEPLAWSQPRQLMATISLGELPCHWVHQKLGPGAQFISTKIHGGVPWTMEVLGILMAEIALRSCVAPVSRRQLAPLCTTRVLE